MIKRALAIAKGPSTTGRTHLLVTWDADGCFHHQKSRHMPTDGALSSVRNSGRGQSASPP